MNLFIFQEPLDLADPKLVQAIWKPEVFFPNAKEGDFQFVTMPNLLIRIHPNGEILYILRCCIVCVVQYCVYLQLPIRMVIILMVCLALHLHNIRKKMNIVQGHSLTFLIADCV